MTQLKLALQRFAARLRVHRPGYSLMEILVAVAIIAVLATLVAPRLFGQLDRSRVTAAETQIRMIETSLDTMRLDIGRYPTEEEGLALLTRPSDAVEGRWAGPYIDEAVPADPWGNTYRYEAPANSSGRARVYSYGADNEEGGSGLDADIGRTPSS
ncbi:type II secretion system protein GspG [Marinicauda pacifica]|jgi:general secretion pathway protein G|uniref:Type II secretion system core protein G n=1 Tax=Marinicauda pacifica TaxID=1133559 RepID=A0A4S2H932_9PROT|nr:MULTISPECIES: type II secretion system major pseudopilin GspG [Marinicauda]TGY92098.1 type II secretion system protein GspG [Marinicauda pacifica]GGE45952.1 type II secretion system protein GspG [Marinicauda pacifica]